MDMLNFNEFHACNAEDTCPNSPWNLKNGVPGMTLPDVYPYGFVSNRGKTPNPVVHHNHTRSRISIILYLIPVYHIFNNFVHLSYFLTKSRIPYFFPMKTAVSWVTFRHPHLQCGMRWGIPQRCTLEHRNVWAMGWLYGTTDEKKNWWSAGRGWSVSPNFWLCYENHGFFTGMKQWKLTPWPT